MQFHKQYHECVGAPSLSQILVVNTHPTFEHGSIIPRGTDEKLASEIDPTIPNYAVDGRLHVHWDVVCVSCDTRVQLNR